MTAQGFISQAWRLVLSIIMGDMPFLIAFLAATQCYTTVNNMQQAYRKGEHTHILSFYYSMSSSHKVHTAYFRTHYHFLFPGIQKALDSVWGKGRMAIKCIILQQLQSKCTRGFLKSLKKFVTSFLVPFMSLLQEVWIELIGTIFPEEKVIRAENQGPRKVVLQLSGK